MGEEFSVSTGYQGYVFVGWAEGQFKTEAGRMMPYANMFVLSPVSNYESEDYKAYGMKAEKKKCLSPQVWEGLEIGNRVKLFFDDKQRVVMAALDERSKRKNSREVAPPGSPPALTGGHYLPTALRGGYHE